MPLVTFILHWRYGVKEKKKKTNTSTPIRSSYYTLYLYEQNMHVLVVVKQKEKWQLYEELRSSMQARETRRFQIGNENYLEE